MFSKRNFISNSYTGTSDIRSRIEIIQLLTNYLISLDVGFVKVYEDIPTTNFTSNSTYAVITLQYKNHDRYLKFTVRGATTASNNRIYFAITTDISTPEYTNAPSSSVTNSMGDEVYKAYIHAIFYTNQIDKEIIFMFKVGGTSYPILSVSDSSSLCISCCMLERFDDSIQTSFLNFGNGMSFTNGYIANKEGSYSMSFINGNDISVDLSLGINKLYKSYVRNTNWMAKNLYSFSNIENIPTDSLITLNEKQYLTLAQLGNPVLFKMG